MCSTNLFTETHSLVWKAILKGVKKSMDGIIKAEMKNLRHNLEQDVKQILNDMMAQVPRHLSRLRLVQSSLDCP